MTSWQLTSKQLEQPGTANEESLCSKGAPCGAARHREHLGCIVLASRKAYRRVPTAHSVVSSNRRLGNLGRAPKGFPPADGERYFLDDGKKSAYGTDSREEEGQ